MAGEKGDESKCENGPLHDRECRDILCCLLFLANCIALLALACYGMAEGDIELLTSLYDSDGNPCGAGDQEDYPYIYFVTPHPDWINRTVCVSECPLYYTDDDGTNYYFGEDEVDITGKPELDCMTNDEVPDCTEECDGINFVSDGIDSSLEVVEFSDFVCIYNSSVVLDKLCWPTGDVVDVLGEELQDALDAALGSNYLADWFADVQTSYPVILGSFGIALAVGLIYMAFVYFLSGIIVWLSILLFFVLLIILAAFCLSESQTIVTFRDENPDDPECVSGWCSTDQQQIYEYSSYGVFVFTGLCLVIFCCQFRNIKLAIAIIKSAADCTKDNLMLMTVAPVGTLFAACFWGLWICGGIYLYSVGEISGSPGSPFAAVERNDDLVNALWYYLFGGFWVNAFIQGCVQFICASVACMWYYSQGQADEKPILPVFTSVKRLFRYHFGSIAFGALLLAIVQTIRVMFEYMKKQMEASGASQNSVTKCLLKCMTCCLYCFERFIQFLTRQAYIRIAITGDNFCVAAKDAMSLLWSNAARATLISGLGGAFMWVGKLTISVSTTFIAYFILTMVDPYAGESNPFLSCSIIFCIAFVIGSLFMSVYGMAIDSILQCFLLDEKLQLGRGNSAPTHCPTQLMQFFDCHVKEQEEKIKAAKEKKQ